MRHQTVSSIYAIVVFHEEKTKSDNEQKQGDDENRRCHRGKVDEIENSSRLYVTTVTAVCLWKVGAPRRRSTESTVAVMV